MLPLKKIVKKLTPSNLENKISFGKSGEIFAKAGFENFVNLNEFDEEKIKFIA